MLDSISPGQSTSRSTGAARWQEGWLSWLTVERLAYGLIALLAMGVRLRGLGHMPLIPAEAVQAVQAWQATAGREPDLAGLSPLLYTLQRATFTLFGADEFTARLWPALLGGLAVLFFLPLRWRLTRGGALVAACLWAISPVGVFASRLGIGDALVPSLSLAVLGAAISAAYGKAGNRIPWLAAALALLLISGPNAYTFLAAALIGLAWRPASARRLWESARARPAATLGVFAAVLVLGATFFFLTPAGLAAAAGLLGSWLSDLAPGRGPYTVGDMILRLLISEPLALIAGGAGLVYAIRRRNHFGLWAGAFGGISLLVPLIGRGRHPVDLALAALALALLGGPPIASVLRRFWAGRSQVDGWLLLALSLAMLFTAGLALPSAANAVNPADWRRVYLLIGLLGAGIGVLCWVVYGIWGSWKTVALAVSVAPLLIGLGWTVGQMVSLSHDRGANRQAAGLVELPAPELAYLRATLRDMSALAGGGASEARVDLAWPDRPGDPVRGMLLWELRDRPGLRVSAGVPADPAPIVLTPQEDQPALAGSYSGSEYPVLNRWRPGGFADLNARMRWVLYRESRAEPETARVILWADQGGR
jgi:hypothetical protein